MRVLRTAQHSSRPEAEAVLWERVFLLVAAYFSASRQAFAEAIADLMSSRA